MVRYRLLRYRVRYRLLSYRVRLNIRCICVLLVVCLGYKYKVRVYFCEIYVGCLFEVVVELNVFLL